MVDTYLVAAFVTTGLVITLGVWLRSGIAWQQPATVSERLPVPISSQPGDGGLSQSEPRFEGVWPAAFVLLIITTVGLTVLGLGAGQTTMLLGFIGATVVAFLVLGVYFMARSHGHPFSHAVGEAIVILGAVWILAVIGWVLLNDGLVF